jgi:hypothetical protein
MCSDAGSINSVDSARRSARRREVEGRLHDGDTVHDILLTRSSAPSHNPQVVAKAQELTTARQQRDTSAYGNGQDGPGHA